MKASKAEKRSPSPVLKPVVVVEPARRILWPYFAGIAAAIAAVFAVYGPALNGPFLLDDSFLPFSVPAYENAPLSAWLRGSRPLLMLSYWLNFESAGGATGPYHFVNVVLHLMNGGLVYLILRKVLDWARADEWHREILSAFGAGLFLLHPLQTEAVSYIASRSETLSVFFFLAAFAVFLYRRSASVTWPVSAAILVLFGAACLTKEHAAVLPALLLLTDYYWNPGFSFEGIRKNWRIYIPILLGGVAAGAFVIRVLSTATSAGFAMKDLTWYQYFFTQCRAIWRYLLFFVLPAGQNLDHDYPLSKTLFDHGAVVGLIGLIALIGAAWYYRRRFPVASYGVFTLLLLLAPTSSVVPIRDTLVERRMYLPFIGFVLVTAGLLRWWKASRFTMAATLGVVLLLEAGLAYSRNVLWGDTIAIWADSVSKAPEKIRPRFQLASAYYLAGKCPEAVEHYAKTAQLEKPGSMLLVNWALALDCAGNPSGALAKFREAGAMDRTAHIYSQIGMEYAKLAQYPQALDALDTAYQIDPNWEMTYVYRGNVYAIQGNQTGAAAEYRRALEIDPQNQSAREGLAALSHR